MNEDGKIDMYDYYVFDLDGVLVDVSDSYKRQIFNEVGEELGYSFSDSQVRNLWHGLGADSRDELLRSWGFDDPKSFWEVFDSIDTPERRLENTYSHDDTHVLESLDANMGVVTHSPPELAVPALKQNDLYQYFDTVVSCSYDIGYKPSPEPIEKCLREIGAQNEKDSSVMVGDSVSDVRGAWNANITGGYIDRLGYSVEADFTIESLTELEFSKNEDIAGD